MLHRGRAVAENRIYKGRWAADKRGTETGGKGGDRRLAKEKVVYNYVSDSEGGDAIRVVSADARGKRFVEIHAIDADRILNVIPLPKVTPTGTSIGNTPGGGRGDEI
jgi:hypothetical protein